ncbi:MAG: ATP-binding protein, partial [Phycisphaerae bacterium]|nr:ATP-binding protein [Phycisphaerae bacterium]
RLGHRVQLLDADVEEPNCHLFCRPTIEHTAPVFVHYPAVDAKACRLCGACSRLCQFGALLSSKNGVLVLPELCHSCGGCILVCPDDAIREVSREVGWVDDGVVPSGTFAQGRLKVGEARAVPVIAALRRRAEPDTTVVLDAPPGTSCTVIEAIRGADRVCLVTEPTPFGLHDLELAVGLARTLGLPFGVIINRIGIGDDRVHRYCERENVRILAEIPNDPRLARAGARGVLAIDAMPELEATFMQIADAIEGCVAR